jgi:cyclase
MSTSRRDFLTSSALAALAATLGRPRASMASMLAQPPQAQPVFTPIRRNVGFYTNRGGTIGYLADPRSTVVVDSQFPAEATALINGLKERSALVPVDFLINTHHHGDHSGGNIAFKGQVRKNVVAHQVAAEHMKNPPAATPAPGANPPTPPSPDTLLLPDKTFTVDWKADAGDERLHAKHYGRAHTSGDIVLTFERANVAHMGDLMFNQRHPVVDRAAGATLRNWATVLDRVPRDHDADTIYIFGHANTGLPVTGKEADLAMFRDYIRGLLSFVEAQVKAGKPREEVLAMRDPLKGFESFGKFGNAGPRDPLTCAFEEITSGI